MNKQISRNYRNLKKLLLLPFSTNLLSRLCHSLSIYLSDSLKKRTAEGKIYVQNRNGNIPKAKVTPWLSVFIRIVVFNFYLWIGYILRSAIRMSLSQDWNVKTRTHFLPALPASRTVNCNVSGLLNQGRQSHHSLNGIAILFLPTLPYP